MGMNLIDNQFNSFGQPWITSQDVDFMQYGIRDMGDNIIQTILGNNFNPLKTYILKGCEVSSDGTDTTITSGVIIGISKALGSMVARTYIYSCAGMTFPDPTGGDVIVAEVKAFNPVYDPVMFADTIPRSIHNEWRVVFSAGAPASKDIDHADMVYVSDAYPFFNVFGDVESTDYKFSRNSSWWYNSAHPGVPTLTLNLLDAIVGKEVIIHSTYDGAGVGIPSDIAYNLINGFGGAGMMIFELGDANPETVTPPTAFTIRIKYLGLQTNPPGGPSEAFAIELKWFY